MRSGDDGTQLVLATAPAIAQAAPRGVRPVRGGCPSSRSSPARVTTWSSPGRRNDRHVATVLRTRMNIDEAPQRLSRGVARRRSWRCPQRGASGRCARGRLNSRITLAHQRAIRTLRHCAPKTVAPCPTTDAASSGSRVRSKTWPDWSVRATRSGVLALCARVKTDRRHGRCRYGHAWQANPGGRSSRQAGAVAECRSRRGVSSPNALPTCAQAGAAAGRDPRR